MPKFSFPDFSAVLKDIDLNFVNEYVLVQNRLIAS